MLDASKSLEDVESLQEVESLNRKINSLLYSLPAMEKMQKLIDMELVIISGNFRRVAMDLLDITVNSFIPMILLRKDRQ